jgi:hypothetical protein
MTLKTLTREGVSLHTGEVVGSIPTAPTIMCRRSASRLLKSSWPSFRGAPISAFTRVFDPLWARTRNPEHRDFLLFWIPGPLLRGVPE